MAVRELGTMYVNQHRHVDKNGNILHDWEDGCDGHETLEKAIECHDEIEKLIKDTAETRSGSITAVLAAIFMEDLRTHGGKLEHRIVKQTITEEVMKGVGAPHEPPQGEVQR